MTHDELLAKVDSVFYEEEGGTQLDFKATNNQYRALRAVVALHKPKNFMVDLDFPWVGCWECEELYPCPTIQAIIKELV